jgi:hypothetical protein
MTKEIECKNCGKNVIPIRNTQKFCSHRCVSQYYSKDAAKRGFLLRKGKSFEELFGKKKAELIKAKMSLKLKSRSLSKKHKENLSLRFKGEKSYRWKGGITSINRRIKSSGAWKDWRKQVFERDNYECVCCGISGLKIELHPHHIIPISIDRTQSFNVNNGLTLCKECHLDKNLGLHVDVPNREGI